MNENISTDKKKLSFLEAEQLFDEFLITNHHISFLNEKWSAKKSDISSKQRRN